MAVTGNVKGGDVLRGEINRLYQLRGYSAYDVAVIEGFEGTEEEWLASLKGEKGDQGIPGTAAYKGDKGDPPSVSFRYDEATGGLYYEVEDVEVLDEVMF